MTVTVEPTAQVSATRQTKRRALRGLRLRQAEKALKSLQTIVRQDNRESRRAEARHYTPYLVLGKAGSESEKAFKASLKRLEAAIAAVL